MHFIETLSAFSDTDNNNFTDSKLYKISVKLKNAANPSLRVRFKLKNKNVHLLGDLDSDIAPRVSIEHAERCAGFAYQSFEIISYSVLFQVSFVFFFSGFQWVAASISFKTNC